MLITLGACAIESPHFLQRRQVGVDIENYDPVAANPGEQANRLERIGLLLKQQRYILWAKYAVVRKLMRRLA